jgi:hypothetical protein
MGCTNTNLTKIKKIIQDDIYDAHVIYLNLLTNVGLIILNNKIRDVFNLRTKISSVTNRMRYEYSKALIFEIQSGRYDGFSYLIEPFVKLERDKIKNIVLRKDFDDDEFYFCNECVFWLKNSDKQIKKHNRGVQHRNSLNKP